jgi:plastocyanin
MKDKDKMMEQEKMKDKGMKHGSGKSNWGGSGYDDCVQKCMSKHGSPPTEWKPTATSGSSGSKGNGATHTVVVAPTQGVLRYVPFALNASVGDTVLFRWNANNHTVTKASALQPCNKTSDSPFTSGTQNKDFEFTQVINDTSTLWFYCGTPNHCQKGMFGAINAPSSFGSPTSVTLKAKDLAAQDPNMAAMWSKMEQDTKGNDRAANWGSNLDMKNLPDWAMSSFVQNVMYTRSFLAANPETLKDDGTIDFSNAASTPLKFPQDLAAPLNAAQAPAATTSAPATGTATTSAPSSSATAAGAISGAMSSTSPAIVFTVMAVVFTFIAM